MEDTKDSQDPAIDLLLCVLEHLDVQVVDIVHQRRDQAQAEDQTIIGHPACKGHLDPSADQAVVLDRHQDQAEVIQDQARRALDHPILLPQVAHQVALAAAEVA